MKVSRTRVRAAVAIAALLSALGCTPVQQGFTQGVTNGLSAAISTLIQEAFMLALAGPDEAG
jgi:hypothetical protein